MGSLGQRIENQLMLADARFFRDLAFWDDPHDAKPVLFLTLMPLVSAFVADSAASVERHSPRLTAALAPHAELLRLSRLRWKLLDDSKLGFDKNLARMQRLATLNSAWFINPHPRTFLDRFKNAVAPDLGVYFLDDTVFLTTHAAFLNLGLDEKQASAATEDTLGPALRATAEDFGGYLATLLGMLAPNEELVHGLETAPPLRVALRDVKSVEFYASMPVNASPQQASVCLLLTSLVSLVNSARVALTVAEEHPCFLLKARFVTLWHAVSSVKQLLDRHARESLLEPTVAEALAALFMNDTLAFTKEHKALRNALVHYDIPDYYAERLDDRLPCGGVADAYLGKSMETVAKEVDEGLAAVSDALANVLPPDLSPTEFL